MEDAPARRRALIEVLHRDGHVLRAVDVAALPFTIGRALDQDLVLDDPFVAPQHARLEAGGDGDAVLLRVGATRNGAVVGGRAHGDGAVVTLADATTPRRAGATSLVLGQTRLALRLPTDAVEPERALPRPPPGGARGLVIAGTLLAAVTAADFAIARDPGADATAWLPLIVGLPGMIVAWCAAWALLSKLFQHRFDFGAHLRVALPWLLLMQLAAVLLPPLGATLGWAWLWRLAGPVALLAAAAMVRRHLALLLPGQRARVTAAVAAAVLVGGAIHLVFVHRATDRLSRPPYMSTLPMAGLRLDGSVAPAALVERVDALAARVQADARQRRADDGPVGDESGDD